MNDKSPFRDEYQSDSETKAEEVPIPTKVVLIPSKTVPQDPTKMYTERYGMAKPKRIVIRAKITHD